MAMYALRVKMAYFAISGKRSLKQSPRDTFIELAMVEYHRFADGISMLSVISSDRYT